MPVELLFSDANFGKNLSVAKIFGEYSTKWWVLMTKPTFRVKSLIIHTLN